MSFFKGTRFFSSTLSRNFSSTTSVFHQQSLRFFTEDYGVFDNYIPTPRKESIFSEAGRKHLIKNLKHGAFNLVGVATVKTNIKGWSPKNFASEAENLYKELNTAYANGDLETIQYICTPSFSQKLKAEIKARSGKFEWEYENQIEPPKIISIRAGNLGKDLTVAQILVRLHSSQAVSVLDNRGRLKSRSKPQDLVEYYVFQRLVSQPNTTWQLYGKVTPVVSA